MENFKLRGDQVVQLKNMLKSLEYRITDLSEIVDDKTYSALRAFQNDYGLKADGVVNINTWNALEKASSRKMPNLSPPVREKLPPVMMDDLPPVPYDQMPMMDDLPPVMPYSRMPMMDDLPPIMPVMPMMDDLPMAMPDDLPPVIPDDQMPMMDDLPPVMPVMPMMDDLPMAMPDDLLPVMPDDPIFTQVPVMMPPEDDMDDIDDMAIATAATGTRPTIRQGDTGAYVIELQDFLNILGFLPSAPDGFFGSATANAVRAFQTASGLTADGIVGPKTWAALDAAMSELSNISSRPTLREGSTGLRVKEVQLRLNTLGYNAGNPDGNFGPQTASAVRQFQTENNLIADGIVGPATWAALDNAFSANPGLTPEVPTVTVREGDTGYEVRLLQEKLRILGFYTGEVDGIFGVKTAEAVRAFQTAYGLEPDGIVGPKTWAVLAEATSIPSSVRPILREGDTGDNVTILQEKLKFLGFFAGSVTGSFGPETTSSVKAFQRSNGLVADGVVGPVTWAALFEQTTTPTLPEPPAPPPPGTRPPGPRPTLRLGDSGIYVTDLQTELQLLMLYNGPITGLFDQETQVAVKMFQDINGLTPDGIVGRSTWNALIALYPPPVICA